MPLYEHVFLARQDISAQQVEGLVQEFRNIIESGGGSIGKTEYWGLKGLTFRIKKNRKAHFSLINIDAPPAAVAELERPMRLSTDIIRDEREGRGDRGDRFDRGDRGDRGDRRGPRRDRDRDFGSRDAPASDVPDMDAEIGEVE